MINKRMFNINNDKKTLHKVGKQWITVSTLLLALIGGGAVASKTVSHADTTNNNAQTVQSQSKQQLNSEKSRNTPVSTNTNIINQANNLHKNLLNNQAQHLATQKQSNNPKNNNSTNKGNSNNITQKPLHHSLSIQQNTPTPNHNVKFKHPNHAHGDIDVFYYKDNSLQHIKQYKDYGNFPNGTQFKLNKFNKSGFRIINGNNVTSFNNEVQTIDLISANPNKAPKKLPRVSKVIGSATDYVNYVDGNKVVAVAYNKSGKATKFDSDLLPYGSDFTAHKYDKLPSNYTISNAIYNKYENQNGYFSNYNGNFGGTQLNIPVELKVQPRPKPQTVNVTVHYVDENGHTIASDNNYKGVAGNPFQFNFKTIPNYSIDYSKLGQDNLIKNAKYPSKNWVTTIVYKSTKKPVTPKEPVTPNKPNNHKQPNKPQVQNVTDYVVYIYNGKQVGSNAFTSTGKKGTADKAFTSFADKFGSDFINNDPQALYINAGLPKGYKLSDNTFNNYGSDFFNNSSYTRAYGSDQYRIPVIAVPNKPQVQNGKIDTKFVVVQPNGSYKVINPTNNPDKSDASLAVNGDHVSDYGKVGQTHDVHGVAYDFDTILSPFMPKGYTASKLNEKGDHGQYDLYDNILNKKDLHFESDGVGDQALEYMKQPQTVYIGIKPIAKPVAKSSIQVRYLDIDANNKEIMTVPKATGKVGSQFDLIAYEDKIPAGYELYDIRNQQYFFGKQDQTVDILLSEVKGRINVNYIDDNNGNTVKQIQLSRKIGAPFNFESYLSGIPSGYEFKDIKNSAVDYFDKDTQNVNIHMTERKPPRLTISTITINYMDGNKVIASKQLSRPVSTNFDIGGYLSNLPAGYEYNGIKDDVDHFDYNNHTIIINMIKPITPNTPTSPTNNKSTSNSSSTTTPSSATSSNSTAPSSQSSSASSSLPEPNLPSSVTPSPASSSSTSSAQSSQPIPAPKSSSTSTPSNSGSNRSSASSRIPKRSAQNRAKIVNKKQSQHVKNRANHSVRYSQLSHSFKSSPIKSTNVHNQNKQNKKEQQKLPQTSEAPDNFLALMTLVSIIDGLMFAYACKHRYV